MGGLGTQEIALHTGRGQAVVKFQIPPRLRERRTGVLFVCTLVGADRKEWPWETGYGGLWIRTKDPPFDL